MDTNIRKQLNISLSPHIHGGRSVNSLMWDVVLALMPSLAVAVWVFGYHAAILTAVCIISCCFFEWIIERFMFHRPSTLRDGSAVITGLLLAFNLPSVLPWWMAVIGAAVAIGIGKMSFGGLGRNIWNPALVGRVFLLLSFPAAMTTWPVDVPAGVDAASGATLLNVMKMNPEAVTQGGADYMTLAIGQMNGSMGEVGAIAILLGLIYLLIRRVVTWHIPVSVLGSAAMFSWMFGGNPLVDLLAGGLMLGACFMATDYVTSPMTPRGQLLFGFMIGFITIIIRRFGAYPEGVSFAILLMNSFVPLIDRWFAPKAFGSGRLSTQSKS